MAFNLKNLFRKNRKTGPGEGGNPSTHDFIENVKRSIAGREYTMQFMSPTPILHPSRGESDLVGMIKSSMAEKRIYGGGLSVEGLDSSYRVVIMEKDVDNPFVVSPDLLKTIKNHALRSNNDYDRAKAVFDWIEQNINYGKKKRRVYGYRNSEEVFGTKEGVCGEMAYLYVTAARCSGLKSNFVDVERDYRNKKVLHACASVEIGQDVVFADPAYHAFDIKHKKYRILNDGEAIGLFRLMRNKGTRD